MSETKEPTGLTDPLMELMREEASASTQLPVVSLNELSAVSFTPTERQLTLQELAIDMEDQGLGYVRDWLKATRSNVVFSKSPVTMPEWNKWMQEPGFASWFYDGFPLPRQMSKEDIQGLDALFWGTLREMMRDGDAKALDLYSKVSGKTGNKEEEDRQTAVVEWLQVNAGAIAWRGGK